MPNNSKPKVLMLGQLPPPWHGQAVATKLLFDHEWPNHEVTALPMPYSSEMEQVGRFQVSKVKTLLSLTCQSVRILRKNPNTILFYPPASASWVPILRDFVFLGITRRFAHKTVFIFHASGLGKFLSKNVIRRWIGRIAYGRADYHLEVAIETESPPHSVFFAKNWKWCPCGIEVPKPPIKGETKGGPLNVLFIGSLQEGKGILEIIKTAAVLKEHSAKSKFVFQIVGHWFSDSFKEEALALQNELDVGEMVHFVGPRTGDEKWQAYQRADLFFFPTHYSSEATPLVLMEALGMGLPVLTTDWAGIPAMLEGCNTAAILPIKSPSDYALWLANFAEKEVENAKTFQDSINFYREKFLPEVFFARIEESWNAVVSPDTVQNLVR